MPNKKNTTSAGCLIGHYENLQTAGKRGSIVLRDFSSHEKLARINRERTPKRIVYVKATDVYCAPKFRVSPKLGKGIAKRLNMNSNLKNKVK